MNDPASTDRPALEAAQAEVDTEQESPDGSLIVTLETKDGSADIIVPRVEDWDSEAFESVNEVKYTTWARLVLSDEDWKKWSNLRPTISEASKFFSSWSDLSGADVGKADRSPRWQRRMKRR